MTNIILIGIKNSGKTSVGKLLAKKLNKTFIDTDDLIIQKYKTQNNILLSCREIAQKNGQDYFRILEENIIADLAHSDKNILQGCIIATGGGCVLSPENVSILKKIGKLIYLSVPYEILKERMFQQVMIPSYLDPENPEKSFALMYEQRKNIYAKIADLEISSQNKSINIIANELITYDTGHAK